MTIASCADINAGSVTNLAYATGSFNNNPISSLQTVALARYKQPTNDRDNNGVSDNGDYGAAVVPVAPVPVMYGSSMYSNPVLAMNLIFISKRLR
jgi:hypothetical protein